MLSALAVADPPMTDAFREACARGLRQHAGRLRLRSGTTTDPGHLAREVIKEGDVSPPRILGVALENHADAYASECSM